jgi:hypothetical protein
MYVSEHGVAATLAGKLWNRKVLIFIGCPNKVLGLETECLTALWNKSLSEEMRDLNNLTYLYARFDLFL